MTIYADASFIVALVVESDEHRPTAWRWWQGNDGPVIQVSRLTIFEAQNTIRGWGVARKCRPSEVTTALHRLHRLLLEGVLLRRRVTDHRLFPHAARLSQFHTTIATYGALDILHVATALELRASTFLSFDKRQRELAEAEGLVVLP